MMGMANRNMHPAHCWSTWCKPVKQVLKPAKDFMFTDQEVKNLLLVLHSNKSVQSGLDLDQFPGGSIPVFFYNDKIQSWRIIREFIKSGSNRVSFFSENFSACQ